MPGRIESYALIGDTQTAALVCNDGSIDWLCLPRFDSDACFSALLGDDRHGRWRISPSGEVLRTQRRYRGDSLVLETEISTAEGCVRLVDLMPIRRREADLVRVVEGVRGNVSVTSRFRARFGYGHDVPWIRTSGGRFSMIAGPEALEFRPPARTTLEDGDLVTTIGVQEGSSAAFELVWHPSNEPAPSPHDLDESVRSTLSWWEDWSERCTYRGAWRDAVTRSLITLKGLTYAPAGGIVAAATTSLPERIGGVRNWDYRYCWVRDATHTLHALLSCGYADEARAWRDWLLRAAAGDPAKLQMLYGPAGERRLTELELDWLPGYEGSRPVRIGNAASEQWQLDVYGELMHAMHVARSSGIDPEEETWSFQRAVMEYLESAWTEPDEGIWEVRGGRRDFTHSKLMAWLAFDSAVRAVEDLGLDGPADRWRACREDARGRVEEAYDEETGAFVQFPGTDRLDASLLMIPLVGFLPADDPRVEGTVRAIEDRLMADGFVHRYEERGTHEVDGLPHGEATFLMCSFWYVDNLCLAGRRDEARRMFEHLLQIRNDVGLLAEEYDPASGRLLGNFPQAFSHESLISTARHLDRAEAGDDAWAGATRAAVPRSGGR